MAFHWRADDDPTLNSGLVALGFFRVSGAVLLRNRYFSGGGGGADPLPPSGSANDIIYFITILNNLNIEVVNSVEPGAV